jgi:hypothetical protein
MTTMMMMMTSRERRHKVAPDRRGGVTATATGVSFTPRFSEAVRTQSNLVNCFNSFPAQAVKTAVRLTCSAVHLAEARCE